MKILPVIVRRQWPPQWKPGRQYKKKKEMRGIKKQRFKIRLLPQQSVVNEVYRRLGTGATEKNQPAEKCAIPHSSVVFDFLTCQKCQNIFFLLYNMMLFYRSKR